MCSVRRASAASSPLPQALNRFVISDVRAWIDRPFRLGGINNYTRTMAGFGGSLPPVSADGNNGTPCSPPESRKTNEPPDNYRSDGESRRSERLRTTKAREDDLF